MKLRRFGNTGVKVSEVGLGCWQLGGSDWGNLSEENALSILQAATERGVTLFDTADVYGMGRSESLIGKFLKTSAIKPFIATKLGRYPEPGWPQNFEASTIRDHIESSLKRLGVASLDLIQLHCIPTDELRTGHVFDTLRALRKEGKIRHFGASVESMDEADICLGQEGLVSLQIIFNIFRQKPIETLFEKARKKGVALIIRLPLASGLLTGKFTKQTEFAASDHRNYNRDGQAFNVGETFAGLPFAEGVVLTETIKPLVPVGMSMAEMALRWCLDFDAVTTIIPGAKDTAMVQSNTNVSSLPSLSPTLHAKLSEFYRNEAASHIRGPY